MQHLRQIGDSDEEHAQDDGHDAQGDGGIAALRRLEGRDAVGDGLGPGHGGAAGGEGPQKEEDEREAL